MTYIRAVKIIIAIESAPNYIYNSTNILLINIIDTNILLYNILIEHAVAGPLSSLVK